MKRAFISYSREDHATVVELARDLQALEWAPWFDEELVSGQRWWDSILDQIEQCDLFVVIATDSFLDSLFCKAELDYANAFGKAILPVSIGTIDVGTLPYDLGALHIFDYAEPEAKSTVLELRDALDKQQPTKPSKKLPERPPLPRTPMQQLDDELRNEELSEENQVTLTHTIRNLLKTEDHEQLGERIETFRARNDLLASVASELDELQERLELQAPERALEPTAKPGTSTAWIPVAIVGALVAVGVAIYYAVGNGEPGPIDTDPSKKGLAPETAPKPGEIIQDTLKDGSQGPQMVIIPGGTFSMGSFERNEESPLRQVTIQPFAIGKYEVTFAEFDVFASTQSVSPKDWGWGRGKLPVIGVSWNDAQAYGEWLSTRTEKNYRLPTEAEWEHAARANTQGKYWWGHKASREYANSGREKCCAGFAEGPDEWINTAQVGSFKPNPFGVHDTSGNVFEWVQDCWHNNYQDAPKDGSAWLDADGGECDSRVVRGGSWYHNPKTARSAYRHRFDPNGRYSTIGFRLVRDIE